MKKIIILLVAFISGIVFYDGYINISQKQYNDVVNIVYKYAEENDMEVIPVDLQLSEDQEERNQQFNKVYAFLKDHDYSCFVSIQSKDTMTEYTYLPQNKPLPIYTVENKEIDFSSDLTSYLSTSYQDEKRYATIDFIDPSYHKDYNKTYRIKPFSNYIKDWNGNTLFLLNFVSHSPDSLLNDLEKAKIINELKLDGTMSTSDFVLTGIDYSFLARIIMYLLIALLLCFISDAFSNKKEIFIRKMQGATSWFIYKKIFGKLYLGSVILFISIQVILYLLIIGHVRLVTGEFILYSTSSVILFILGLIFVGVVTYSLLANISSLIILKKTSVQWLHPLLFGMKCIFIVSISLPLLNAFEYTFEVGQDGYYLKKYQSNFQDYLRLEGLNINMLSMDFNEVVKELEQKMKQYPYIYEDFSSKIDREGNGIVQPYVYVNEEFLKDYALFKEGKQITEFKEGTMYVPKSIENIESYCLANHCEYETIDPGYTLISHRVNTQNWRIKDPVIYIIDESNMNIFNILIQDSDQKIKNELEAFLKEKNIYESANFIYETKSYNGKVQLIFKLLVDSTILFVVYMIILMLFQYQAISLYFMENQKKIALNCLFGKNLWQKYRSLLLLNGLIYIVLAVWLFVVLKAFTSTAIILLIFSMSIDGMMMIMFKNYFEKRRVLAALKGDLE